MSEFDRYLYICNPYVDDYETLIAWREAVRQVANAILRDDRTPWQITEMLATIAANGRLCTDGFGNKVIATINSAGLEVSKFGSGLIGAVCTLCAVIYILTNQKLRANAHKRDLIAVSLWSALSFQRPLSEWMWEELREEVLNRARDAAMAMASRERARSSIPANRTDKVNLAAYRAVLNNAQLDTEEIRILRWILANESTLLYRPFTRSDSSVAEVLAKGLELGLLLSRFPCFEHYELVSRSAKTSKTLNLVVLLECLGEDRESLSVQFQEEEVIRACPAGFPLLTALLEGSSVGSAPQIGRSLQDWCGRALLESANCVLAKRTRRLPS